MGKLGDRLKRDMVDRNMNETQYGAFTGAGQQNINNWVKKGTLPNSNNTALAKLSSATGIHITELLSLRDEDAIAGGKKPQGNIPQSARDTVAKINGPIFMSNANDLPIRGLSAGGNMERIVFSGNDIYEHAERPPSLVGIGEAYGVEMREMSMADRYLPNRDILHVNPRAPLFPGEFVVIHVKDRNSSDILGFVKQFKGWEGEKAVFTQLNPPKTIKFKNEDLEAIHVIVGTGRKR